MTEEKKVWSNPDCWRAGEEHQLNDTLFHKAKDNIEAFIRNAKTVEEISDIAKVCLVEFETLVTLRKVNEKRYTIIPYLSAMQKYYKKQLELKHYQG